MLNKAQYDLFNSYCNYSKEYRRHTLSKTFFGKLLKIFSIILAIICVVKIFNSGRSYLFGRNKGLDPIRKTLNITFNLLSWSVKDSSYQNLTEVISLSFTGWLTFSNTRGFVINLTNFLNAFLG